MDELGAEEGGNNSGGGVSEREFTVGCLALEVGGDDQGFLGKKTNLLLLPLGGGGGQYLPSITIRSPIFTAVVERMIN